MSTPPSDPAAALEWIRSHRDRVGVCARCAHLRAVATARSVFVRCALAATDDRFARYPVLPVEACPGLEEP